MTDSVESRADRILREREERAKSIRKQNKARRRKALAAKVASYGIAGVGILVALVALILLSALIFKVFAWNLGVVGLVTALGGSASKISFGTAVGTVLLIGFLSRIFASHNAADVKVKK